MSIYKDSMGRPRTTSLFVELCQDPIKYPPLYTLADEDTLDGSLKSASNIYINSNTEYKAAKVLVGSWANWQAVKASVILAQYIAVWEEERIERLRSIGIEALLLNSVDCAAAAKWFAERKFVEKANKFYNKNNQRTEEDKTASFLSDEYKRITKK